jgi:predicted ATPase
MANADLEHFRLKLREYRLLVNRNQGDLAAYLDLDYSELSNRLHAHKNARLSHDNVRTLVRALAEWGAIATREQAEELLDLMLCPHFDRADWQARPLSKLAASPTLLIPTYTPTAFYPNQIPVDPTATALPTPSPGSDSLHALINYQPATPTRLQPPSNLPQTLNPLLGRKRELAQLVELLTRSKNRLVTLTGAGGSGKTSLALEVGKHLPPAFRDGIYFVRLENVTRRESLIAEIAGTLKVKETTGQSLLQSLKEYLKETQFLLILDNFEQLVIEAGVLSELLQETGHLKLLVTSRVSLQLSFELEFPVGSLALPDKEAVANREPGKLTKDYAGLTLFVERARAVRPDFVLSLENVHPVVEICRRLDGMPLALELAAARVRSFTPHKLLERLSLKVLTGGARDLPARQQTLRNTIAWSYDLLSEGEQRLFARLAIFAGGCTLEAAEDICNPTGELALEVFEGVEALLARNLLKQWPGVDGETRYGMLVTIREFGLEKLAASGEARELEQRYTAYYLALSRQLEPQRSGVNASRDKRLRQVESEYANFRALLYQALEGGKVEEALGLGVTLGDYFVSRGYVSEGLRFMEQGLALPYSPDSPPTTRALRAKALYWTGIFTANLGDVVTFVRYIEEALVLQRELQDKGGIIFSLNRLIPIYNGQGNFTIADRYLAESLALSLELGEEDYLENTRSTLGQTTFARGKYEEARRLFQENLAMCSASGNKWGEATTLLQLGYVGVFQGNYREARQNIEQCLALFRELGLNWGISNSLNTLGLIAINQGEYRQAQVYSNQSLTMSREFGYREGTAFSLFALGSNALCEANYREARSYLEESMALYLEIGGKMMQASVLALLGLTAANQGEELEARRDYAKSLAISREPGNQLPLAQSLTGLAGLWIQDWLKLEGKDAPNSLNYPVRVARLSGAIAALLTSAGAVMFPPFLPLYEQNLVVVRAKLDEASFEAAFAEGQLMTMDEAVAYALAE